MPDEGEIEVTAGGRFTVKPLKAWDVPIGDVMVRVRKPAAAVDATVIVIGALVAVTPLRIVATAAPLNATLDAPSKSEPRMVADREAPCDPNEGDIAVIVGTAAPSFTVKPGMEQKSQPATLR
jgi:hypothetical protein